MSIDEALKYIHAVDWKGSVLGLERISELLALMGNPEERMNIIHVAGTNGKGSVCAMLTSVFTQAGLTVGTYTSPGLMSYNERIKLCGENITDDELADTTEYVKGFADRMTDSPTEFELFNAIALAYFEKKKCSVVILEVGLGGTLDSTNTIKSPLISIITSIALDHTRELGSTISDIARAKAGIIKAGRPCLFGGGSPEAETVIREVAEERGAPFFVMDDYDLEIKKSDISGSKFDFCGRQGVKIPLLGLYQPHNAAIALSAIDVIRSGGFDIPEEAVIAGLAKVEWQARFEKLSDKPLIITDGAHNPHGIRAAVESIKHYFPGKKINLVMGVLADKDYRTMTELLLPVISEAFTFTTDNPRALDGETLSKLFREGGKKSGSFADAESAVTAAFKLTASEKNSVMINLGSLYIYPAVKAAVERLKSE